jgi:phosphate uptake regulator
METRKIQRSGTTYYLYLPASWCREHKITTDSLVYLEKSSKGDLSVQPKKSESSLSSLKFELNDTSKEVINKIIIASFINPVKDFHISLKQDISPDQILEHKKLLGGLELVDFDEDSINCQSSLSLGDPDIMLKTMITKILSISNLMKKDHKHELIKRYEEEIDKTNLLILKSIITNLMYRKESKLRHVDLFYIGQISRNLEQITDILITLENQNRLIEVIESMMRSLIKLLDNMNQASVINFIKNIEKLGDIEVKNLETYKKKRIYSLLGHISETMCDKLITDIIDRQ